MPKGAADGEGLQAERRDGLYLIVRTDGSRCWRMNYREGGRQCTASFGACRQVSLNDARLRTQDLRARPKERGPTTETARDTFGSVAREWFSVREAAWVPSHHERVGSRIERDLIEPLGTMPIGCMTASQLLAILRGIERGAVDIAKRVRQHADQISAHTFVTGRVERNVAADLRGAMAAPRG